MPTFHRLPFFRSGEQQQIRAAQFPGGFEESSDFPVSDVSTSGISTHLDEGGHGSVLEDHEINLCALRVLPGEDAYLAAELPPVQSHRDKILQQPRMLS